ncbi:MAG: ATP-binding protein [Candidatus Krumholzibacteriota bacterium]|nr:ATP-binding protein [Candidatus Krumholzibacteriota bacterium]
MKNRTLYILNLQPALHAEFFAGTRLPADVTVKSYKTFPRFLQSIQAIKDDSPNIVMFLPDRKLDHSKTRQLRLAQIDSPVYIITPECNEKDYLTYLSMGVNGIINPPFNQCDLQAVLNGREQLEIPFPRNKELTREGQVRLDFLIPSKLSRILGVNRLISFLASEFGFPAEECRVNLPMVMDEALSNAIIHGNRGEEDKKVHVRIYISSRRIIIQVEDQGEGFIPAEVSDPTAQENIYRGSGRGIYLLKELMDSVIFKKGGAVVELTKHNPFFTEQS